jgi:hypothetical protein
MYIGNLFFTLSFGGGGWVVWAKWNYLHLKKTVTFCDDPLVKTIVKSAKYPVDNMPSLWNTITLFHKDGVPEIIKLAQYALTLPLHTCSCKRVFSNQNLIVTRLRSRLSPKTSDRLLRVKTQGKGITKHDFQKLFKQMKGSKEQTLEKKDFYYSVDSLY